MTQKERHRIYDAAALLLTSLGNALAMPVLISAHDDVGLIAGFFLLLGWATCALLYLYRMKG